MKKTKKLGIFKLFFGLLIIGFLSINIVRLDIFRARNLSAEIVEPDSGNVSKIVVIIHGFGSNADEIINLAYDYKNDFPDTLFVAPYAPARAPFFVRPFANARQWFKNNNWTFKDKEGIEYSKVLLEKYIDKLVAKYNLEYKDVAIIGFSQGTMQGIYSSLRFKNKIAGFIGFSGGSLWSSELKGKDYQHVPVFLYHGTADRTLPHKYSVSMHKDLKALGLDVSLTLEDGVDHYISEQGIEKSKIFLKRIFKKENERKRKVKWI